MKKIICVNLILLFCIFAGFELVSHYIYLKVILNKQNITAKDLFKYSVPEIMAADSFVLEETIFPAKNNKRPVVTIGCSFIEGVEGFNKSLAYEINRRTGIKTYNRGKSATGPSFVLYQLKSKEFKEQIPDAEYFIYIAIYDHFYARTYRRLLFFEDKHSLYQPLYKRSKNNKLVEKKAYPFLYPFYTVKVLLYFKNHIEEKMAEKNGFDLYLETMKESNNIIKSQYPGAKFVFIFWPVRINPDISPQQIKDIKDLGIIYYNAADLLGKDINDSKYLSFDGYHPNYYAYQKLTEELVKKLDL